ncbi:cupin domain-containing protein [Candidatus Aminicenantes bacterium AC-335-A11]|jgi:quercetin dioxygenase-like cupin family protein|nr:cupin domain-containing protein [SCandidatus Aminicenantes bacterium Aminicenantia_JdfR_composite]MCP2597949.1 cupin domain-containing protein [Candidatus Aminicenantes bacterium AC-335-L06]MCP2618531.1 cupin domain-containing protein [Candidatus Aminicenantes bacterium AC-335-A11]
MIKKTEKPWGYELLFALTDSYAGKVIKIHAGHRLSYQYHEIKEETIYLQEGKMKLIVEENGEKKEKILEKGNSYHIPPKLKHRMEAIEDCTIFEVSTPHLNDVVRLEDDYGRLNKK